MATLSDARFDSLRAQGFTGATSDMLIQWLQLFGATSPATADAWLEMLTAQGAVGSQRNDMWYDFLDQRAPGTVGRQVNDLELWFWGDAGGIPGDFASAGGPYQADVDVATQLSGSYYIDGSSSATFLWSIVTGGVTGTFTPSNTVQNPTFTPDHIGQYTLRIVVTPDVGLAQQDDSFFDSMPVVDAGGPYAGTQTTAIALDSTVGIGLGPTPAYLWTADGAGTFSNDAIQDPTFTPDNSGSYVLTLTASLVDIPDTSDTADLVVTQAALFFNAPLLGNLNATGAGPSQTPTFSRASEGTVVDRDGIVHKLAAGVPRFSGNPLDTDSSGVTYNGAQFGDSFALQGNMGLSIHLKISPTYNYISYGQGGAKMATIETNFNADWTGTEDFVILEGGTNDVNTANSDPNAAMQTAMANMMTSALGSGQKVALVGIQPWGNNVNWTGTRQTYTDDYNAWAKATYPNNFVDVYAIMEDPSNVNDLWAKYDNGDGLHPNADGYKVIDDGIVSVIFNDVFQVDGDGPYGFFSEGIEINHFLNSERFESGSYTRSRMTPLDNVAIAPDGTMTAASLTPDVGIAQNYSIRQEIAVGASPTTGSIYLKAGEIEWVVLYLTDNGAAPNYGAFFNTRTGTFGEAFIGYPPRFGARQLANGWWRVYMSTDDNYVIPRWQFYAAQGDGVRNYDANGTDKFYVWGNQVETSFEPSSYIYTLSDEMTREPDSLTYPDTGNIVDAAGSCSADFASHWNEARNNSVIVGRDDNGRILYVPTGVNTQSIYSRDGTTSVSAQNIGFGFETAPQDINVTWDTTPEFVVSKNGTPGTPGVYAETFGTGNLAIGGTNDGGNPANGFIRLVKITEGA